MVNGRLQTGADHIWPAGLSFVRLLTATIADVVISPLFRPILTSGRTENSSESHDQSGKNRKPAYWPDGNHGCSSQQVASANGSAVGADFLKLLKAFAHRIKAVSC